MSLTEQSGLLAGSPGSPGSLPGDRSWIGTANTARVITFASSFSEGWELILFSTLVVSLVREFQLSALELGLLASVPLLAGLLGGVLMGVLMDHVGRKPTIVLTYLICIAGSITIATAPTVLVVGIGRSLVLFGVKGGVTAVTVYMTELSPAGSRGRLVSLEELYINMGIMAAVLAAWLLLGKGLVTWRIFACIGACAPAVALLCFLILSVPESPRFLQQQNREDEALQTLRSALDGDEVEAARVLEIWKMEAQEAAKQEANLDKPSKLEEIRKVLQHRGFLVATGCWLAKSASGIVMIVTYFNLFLAWGMDQETTSGWFVAGHLTKTVALVIPCLWLIDILGRRILLLSSASGCCFALSLAAAGGLFAADAVFLAVCLVVYFGFFSLGYGPVTWVYCSEVLANKNRGKLSGASQIPQNFLDFVFLFSGPMLYETNRYLPYAVVAITNGLAIVFFWLYCPETRGLVLEEAKLAGSA
eukprot:gnl/TRDRNA2_/TRDRNA2_159298_c0_seq1.p1 gnl/TRDRNA2_/TRDRNA2_159298_c0~~gnl/TRDRNA2_/TRDRNA2_159298_c0_seq1.p1  ORF type:complete len:476 (-),score=77.01 gnl/TRDRNA2_/TRDRNA2_159298_c0_seq1:25-1452(-)